MSAQGHVSRWLCLQASLNMRLRCSHAFASLTFSLNALSILRLSAITQEPVRQIKFLLVSSSHG